MRVTKYTIAAIFLLCAGITPASPARPSTTSVPPPAADAANGPYTGYYTWPEVEAKIAEWKERYPNLVQIQSLGRTREGRDIPVLRISAAPDGANKPEVMLLSGIHPREQQPIIGIVDLLDEILGGYGKNSRFTRMLDNEVLWVTPIFNVDGKVYDLSHGNGTTRGADWRKNREPNPDGTFGIDLNRNFGVRWGGARAIDPTWKTSTTVTKDDIYEGPAPMSEPETQDLTRFLIAHRQNMRAFLDLHSPLHEINVPEYIEGSEYDNYGKLVAAMRASQAIPYKLTGFKHDVEPAAAPRGGDSGITYTWVFYTQGIYALNLEFAPPAEARVGVRARYAPPAEIEAEYQKNIRGALLAFIEVGGDLPASHINDIVSDAAPDPGTLSAPPTPGATIVWTPPAIKTPWSYAVLVSEGAAITVPSEYRRAPMQQGFTLQIAANAKPGAVVPMTLYIWDRNRGETIEKLQMSVAAPK